MNKSYEDKRKHNRREDDRHGHHVHIHCNTYVVIHDATYQFDRLFMGADYSAGEDKTAPDRDDSPDEDQPTSVTK